MAARGSGRQGVEGKLDRALDELYASGPRAGETREAQARLRRRLRAAQAPVFYDALERSPLGTVYLAGGERGLIAIGLATDESQFTARLASATGAAPVRSAQHLRQARRQLQEYLGGKRATLDLPIDLQSATPFQRIVLEAARRVPRGTVFTYGQLAARLGRPKAGRAVGQALAHNPLPIVIPCHRVVSQGGHLRGYLGDRLGLKARLLRLEGVAVQGDRRVTPGASGGDR